MASNLVEAIRLLGKIGDWELTQFDMSINREKTYHRVRHRFREEMIVPIIGITNNFDFLLGKNSKKHILTADEVKCIVVDYRNDHICDLEADIRRIYGMEAWDFIKRWYNNEPNMVSMEFVWMKIEKYEEENDGEGESTVQNG